MPSKTMYVIFSGPQQHGGPSRYIDKVGKPTDLKGRAAKFYTHADAVEFARTKKIALTEYTYIGQDDFTDFEIQSGD